MNPLQGYVDLQVNGYAGVDFNSDDLSAERLHRACVMMRDHGVSQALATIITDDLSAMGRRLARLVQLRQADALVQQVISGLHIEGPFLNPEPGYRGAHPAPHMKPANLNDMRRLLDAGQGLTRIVTLAPEHDAGFATTRMLTQAGVVVSAGHSNASRDDLQRALDAGLGMYTHLGNGCPMNMHRHDNIVQRVLSLADRFKALCFIADGVHVPTFALRNYLQLAGAQRAVVVTDAMAAAGLGPGRFRLASWEVQVGEDGAAWAPDRSHLVGSAMTMRQAGLLLHDKLGLTEAQVLALVRDNPARLLAGR